MEYRIDDLLDEYRDTSISLKTMEYTSADAIKEMTVNKISSQGCGTRRRRKPGVILAAAVAATLLVGTAVASSAKFFSTRDVEDSSETAYYSDIGNGQYQYVEFPDTTFAIELDIPEDAQPQEHMVYYRVNWLPTEYEGRTIPAQDPKLLQMDDEGWMPFTAQVCADLGFVGGQLTPNCDIIAYQVNINTLQEHEYDIVRYLSGDVTLVKQEYWNGWDCIELTADYRAEDSGAKWDTPVNYLLMYNSKDNIFVNICGMMDFEALEKIAQNMEIRVSDELYEYTVPEDIGTPAGMLNMGRG